MTQIEKLSKGNIPHILYTMGSKNLGNLGNSKSNINLESNSNF